MSLTNSSISPEPTEDTAYTSQPSSKSDNAMKTVIIIVPVIIFLIIVLCCYKTLRRPAPRRRQPKERPSSVLSTTSSFHSAAGRPPEAGAPSDAPELFSPVNAPLAAAAHALRRPGPSRESVRSLPPYEPFPPAYARPPGTQKQKQSAEEGGPRSGSPTDQVDDFSGRVGVGAGAEVEVEQEGGRDSQDPSYPPGLGPAPQYPPKAAIH